MPSSVRPIPSDPPSLDWKGTDRYEVVRCLGQGGMGAVYEAWDRERAQPVALKTLLNVTPATLYLFKQEFRTLADVSHTNLVRLYELVATGSEHIFFAMELVRGTDFLTHVHKPGEVIGSDRPKSFPENGASRARPTSSRPPILVDATQARDKAADPPRRRSPADFDRLRPALAQLVEGVMALHAARKLHRDIKPPNVLVTSEGRIVLLDFGVATEFAHVVDEEMAEENQMAGTLRYMAPEQAFEPPTPACDWYAVGVMLYEALVGRPPFTGSTVDILATKNSVDPLPPSVCVSGVPADLDALCVSLLHREPTVRPDGPAILARLGMSPEAPVGGVASVVLRESGEIRRHSGLAGRELQLQALAEVFEWTKSGRSVTVRVGGRSGMGKSALAQRFVDDLVEQGSAVVLRGRAYEREAVPYKAFDSAIDALSRYLMCLGDEDLSVALPKDTWAVARLFPVLRRVPAIGALAEEPISDPQRVRRRAFLALRELFSSLARRRPIVVFVDDAHWGDEDSAALWLDLVRPPYAPPLLLIMTYRDEEAEASRFLSAIKARWPEGAEQREISVGPLLEKDARELAVALLGSGGDSVRAMAAAIAHEAGGNPFLLEEISLSVGARVRGASAAEASTALTSVTLDDLVTERVRALSEEARRLLQMVAVSGRPLATLVAMRAANVSKSAGEEVISLLRVHRFVRTGLRDGHEVLESVHARIGEAIVGQLGASVVREHHATLASALEAQPNVDVEALATHLAGAGQTARAAEFAERAAELAVDKLAFDQAARLLRLTLETHPASTADGIRLRKRLAEILEWSGRSADAARIYLEAAEAAPALQQLDLRRNAAEQFYASGRMEEGTQVLRQVIANVGRRPPRSHITAFLWVAVYHFWLRFVGVHFKEREPHQVLPEHRLRIDALYAAVFGFSLVDQIMCMAMRATILRESLRYGDRLHVARAACAVACDMGGDGPETEAERTLWQISERLAEKENTPAARLAVRAFMGVTLVIRGRWREARQSLDPVTAMVTNRRFALQSSALFCLYAIYFMGDLIELTQRYRRLVAEADESGNIFMAANLRAITAVPVWLAADDPVTARREIGLAAVWTQGKFSTEWRVAIFATDLDLYVGDGERAYQRVRGLHRTVRKNFYLFVQYVRAMTAFAQGRAAIASLATAPTPIHGERLGEVRALERRLDREKVPWIEAIAAILRACRLRACGDRAACAAALREANDKALEADMVIHAAAARRHLGLLLGGSDGEGLIRDADDTMTARGIRAPERYALMILPGRWVS